MHVIKIRHIIFFLKITFSVRHTPSSFGLANGLADGSSWWPFDQGPWDYLSASFLGEKEVGF